MTVHDFSPAFSADHLAYREGVSELPWLEESAQSTAEALAVPRTDDVTASGPVPDQTPHRRHLLRLHRRERDPGGGGQCGGVL